MRSLAFLTGYVICINLLGLFLMWSDKRRAKRLAYRIPESTLFATALIGGSVGTLLGMFLFRHKTKKRCFLIGLPVIVAAQILVLLILIRSSLQILFL